MLVVGHNVLGLRLLGLARVGAVPWGSNRLPIFFGAFVLILVITLQEHGLGPHLLLGPRTYIYRIGTAHIYRIGTTHLYRIEGLGGVAVRIKWCIQPPCCCVIMSPQGRQGRGPSYWASKWHFFLPMVANCFCAIVCMC